MKQLILILLIATAFRLALEIVMPTGGGTANDVSQTAVVGRVSESPKSKPPRRPRTYAKDPPPIKPAAVTPPMPPPVKEVVPVKPPPQIDVLQNLKKRGIWDNQVTIHETGHLIAYVILALKTGHNPVIEKVDLKGGENYGGAVMFDRGYMNTADGIRIKLAGAAAWVAYQNPKQCSEALLIDEYEYFTRTQNGTKDSDYSVIAKEAGRAKIGKKELLAEFRALVTMFRTTHYNALITTAAAIPKDAVLSPAACGRLRDLIVQKINEIK